MKLNTFSIDKIKLLALFYLLIVLSTDIMAMERTKRSHRKHKLNKSSTIPPSNPSVKLFIGFTQGLIGSESNWEECLPREYLEGTPNLSSEGFIEQHFAQISPKLQTIKNALNSVERVVNWFCSTKNYRDTVVNLYAWTFNHKSKKKRKIFLEGHFKRRGGPSKEFFINIGKSVVCAAQAVASECNHIKEVFDSEKQQVLDTLTPHIENLKFVIHEILNQPGLKKLIDYGKCVVRISQVANESANLIGSFGETVDSVVLEGVSNVGFMKIAKIVWNIICNLSNFYHVIDLTASAVGASTPENYYFWGQALGKLVNTIGNISTK
jgi:hypothetical protein